MAIPANLVRMIESLRRSWPAGRTVEDLARELDIHPWRAVDLLGRCEGLGVSLERSGSALRLDPAACPLLGELIELGAAAGRIGRSVIVFKQTASTNDVAWQAARQRDSDGLVVLAETQSAGRGRLGRTWFDRPGACLLFSVLLLDVPRQPALANRLVMAASVGIAEAIGTAIGLLPAIRWPNDLCLHGRKFAGILLESRRAGEQGAGVLDVVLGVGINCNLAIDAFDEPLRETAASLSAELGSPVDRTALMRAILARLDHWLIDGGESSGSLHRRYVELMDHQALAVRIHHDRRTIEGTVRDVDPIEGLIVELPAGGVAHYLPSQVSVEWIGRGGGGGSARQ